MGRLKSPLTQLALAVAAIGALCMLSSSPNVWLWATCLLTVPALIFLIGGRKAPPVLMFILGISWLQIAAIIVVADIRGVSVASIDHVYESYIASPYAPRAIMYSLAAMLVVAFGIRLSGELGIFIFHPARGRSSILERQRLTLGRALIGYGVAAPLATVAGVLAWKVTPLTQILLPLTMLKFVFVYMVAAVVLDTRKGYLWLFLIMSYEVASGTLAYFSQFKEAIFVLIIAFLASRRRLTAMQWLIGGIAVVGVIWMSLVWTDIKTEYRRSVWSMSFDQKVDYLAGKYFDSDIDYAAATSRLLERIQYTGLFSKVIELGDAGMLPPTQYYKDAIIHILEPRFLFPDKGTLDDSEETTRLIGLRIANGTSMGVGYVAEAYADFGFPTLLFPMFAIGALMGLAAKYFMTRPAPLLLREAFVTAALFSCFSFEANTSKNVGTFVMQWVILALVLKFIAPLISVGLSAAPSRPNGSASRSVPSMSSHNPGELHRLGRSDPA